MTYGPDVDKVVSKVLTNSLPVQVVNARFFKPLDEVMLQRLAEEGKPVIVYETDMLAGGLSSAILAMGCRSSGGDDHPARRHRRYLRTAGFAE